MKATIEIIDGQFKVEVISTGTRYSASGTIVLDEDAKDIRGSIEALTKSIISKSDNYTQSKATANK